MTKLLYLEDQDLHNSTAIIVDILETEKGIALVLDQTIFYVQGGGQPGDEGLIKVGNNLFKVIDTTRDENGTVLHLGIFEGQNFKIGDEVSLEIDVESHKLNSKIHSAGHLIDLVIKNLKLDWIPGKGFHYPEGSYVEYTVQNDTQFDFENLKNLIQAEYNSLVSQNLPVKITLDPTKSIKGLPLREISFDGQSPCPCGGTHVTSTSELNGFEITKIKLKSGIVKVSYRLIE